MNILYIAVHHHVGWGAEHWLANALERTGHSVGRFDYRARRKKFKPWWLIRHELFGLVDTYKPDAVLIQRAEKMPLSIPQMFNVPVIFWSTEPLARRRDVDKLLHANKEIDWVFVHTYTCLSIIEKEFPHLIGRCSVMHNAGAIEYNALESKRTRLAIHNRNLSPRRTEWLSAVEDLVDVVTDSFGEPYFEDLRSSKIAVNIHYAEQSVDDFETGIFEALASGCVVVTETLNPRTVNDMGMEDAVIQVESPAQLRETILALKDDPDRIAHYQRAGQAALVNNRWDSRAMSILDKFAEIAAL